MRALVVAAILLLPAEAHLSGSSVVTADSQWFSVQLMSPRKIFDRGQGEADWHREWRAENQKRVDGARARLESVFPSLVKRHRLAKYRAELPLVEPGREDEEPTAEILKSKKPFRYRFEIGEFSIFVGFAALPPPAARDQLKKSLERALSAD